MHQEDAREVKIAKLVKHVITVSIVLEEAAVVEFAEVAMK